MKMQFRNLAVRSGISIMTTVLLVACSNANYKEDETANKNTPTATEQVTEATNPKAPDISFRDENGKVASINSLKGKVVFINFWATWCPPCIQEMPSINQLKQSFKDNDDIVFLLVDVDANIKKSTAFMKKNKYDLPVYVPTSNIPQDYLGEAIPTTVILNKNGDMIARMEGGRDYTNPQMVNALKELVESD